MTGFLLRTGNGLSYPPRYETPLNQGVEARLLHARGAWLQIELSGGEVGWGPRRLYDPRAGMKSFVRAENLFLPPGRSPYNEGAERRCMS